MLVLSRVLPSVLSLVHSQCYMSVVLGIRMINKNDKNYKEIEQMCGFIASAPKRLGIGDLEKLADLLNFYLEDQFRTNPMYTLDED
jgi:hypothetical protein